MREQRRVPSEAPAQPRRGWLLYDGDCGLCTRWAMRLRRPLKRAGYELATLGDPWVRDHFDELDEKQLRRAVRVLRSDGVHYWAGDAWIHISRHVWWLWPIWLAGQLPPLRVVIRWTYRWVARHRDWLGRFM